MCHYTKDHLWASFSTTQVGGTRCHTNYLWYNSGQYWFCLVSLQTFFQMEVLLFELVVLPLQKGTTTCLKQDCSRFEKGLPPFSYRDSTLARYLYSCSGSTLHSRVLHPYNPTPTLHQHLHWNINKLPYLPFICWRLLSALFYLRKTQARVLCKQHQDHTIQNRGLYWHLHGFPMTLNFNTIPCQQFKIFILPLWFWMAQPHLWIWLNISSLSPLRPVIP